MGRVLSAFLVASAALAASAWAQAPVPVRPVPYDLSAPAHPKAYTESEKADQRDRARDVLARMRAAIAAKAPSFTIPPGVYRIAATIALDRVTDFTLVARDVEFIMEADPVRDFMSLFACERFAIEGPLVIDCDPIAFSQGEIVAFDAAAKALEVRILEGYKTTLRPGRIMIFDREGRWLPQTMNDFSAPQPAVGRHLRVTVPASEEMAPLYRPGNLIAFESPGAAFAARQSNYRFTDVSVYGGYNMITWEDQAIGPNLYQRCRITRRPGTNRLIGGAGPQQNYASGGPRYEQCEFAYCWDDNINLLNFVHMVHRQENPRTVVVKPASGRNPFRAGDTARFYRYDSFARAGWAVVASSAALDDAACVEEANRAARALQPRDLGDGRCVRLALDRDVAVRQSDYAESSDLHTRDVVIKDCWFHDFMCRTMVQGVGRGLIEGNVIERAGLAAIDVRADAYWWEGATSEKVVIRNNVIKDSPYSLFAACCAFQMSGAISVGPSNSPGRAAATEYLFKDFVIEGNTISDPMFSGIVAKNMSGLRIVDNTLVRPVARSGPVPGTAYYGVVPAAGIFLHAVKGATVEGNRMQASPNCATVVQVGAHVDRASLTLADNRIGPVSSVRKKPGAANRAARRGDRTASGRAATAAAGRDSPLRLFRK